MKRCKEQGYYIIDNKAQEENKGELFILKIIGIQGLHFIYNGVVWSKRITYVSSTYHSYMEISVFSRLNNSPNKKEVIDKKEFISLVRQKMQINKGPMDRFIKILEDEEV